MPVYEALLGALGREGAEWVQLDEPCLVTDLDDAARGAFRTAYERIAKVADAPRTLLTTYFGALGDNLELGTSLPVAGVHVDLVRGREQLDAVSKALPKDRVLSAGVIDGRNVWRADLDDALGLLKKVADVRGTDKLFVGPSCSLLHSPVDRSTETDLDPELSDWLAFATDKLEEIGALAKAVDGNVTADVFEKSRAAKASRAASKRVNRPAVAARLESADGRHGTPEEPLCRTSREAESARAVPPSDDDDRHVPADFRGPRRACRAQGQEA